MINFFKIFLVLLLVITSLNAGFLGDTLKDTVKVGAVYGAKKALDSEAGKQVVKAVKEKIHKNSKEYVGDSHVYRIKNKDGTYKIGESSQGKDKFGNSKRAESQAAKLKKDSGDSSYQSEIRKEFESKAEARDYETKFIEKTRSLYGDSKNDKTILPGNKTNR